MSIEFGKTYTGKISWFGGSLDTGCTIIEGLALYNDTSKTPELFLPEDPENPMGLARRLDPNTFYCAMRWDYSITPKSVLRESRVAIRNPKNNLKIHATPVDWGPHIDTERLIDASPAVLKWLEVQTDDIVECTLMEIKE